MAGTEKRRSTKHRNTDTMSAANDLPPRKLDCFGLEFSVPPRVCWRERRTMKASKFSDAQKAFILKQGAEGIPVGDICRKAGISQATYFNWK